MDKGAQEDLALRGFVEHRGDDEVGWRRTEKRPTVKAHSKFECLSEMMMMMMMLMIFHFLPVYSFTSLLFFSHINNASLSGPFRFFFSSFFSL